MNLKEAFRYQNYLDMLMDAAQANINTRNAMKVVRAHQCSASNPEAEDWIEVVERENYYNIDSVLSFALWLIGERYGLSAAITEAKELAPCSIDAEIEENKFRQRLARSIGNLLQSKTGKSKTTGKGYKLDINKTQVPYVYDILETQEDDFDRSEARRIMKKLQSQSDVTSSEIERVFLSAEVDYTPPFQVDSPFEEVFAEYLSRN